MNLTVCQTQSSGDTDRERRPLLQEVTNQEEGRVHWCLGMKESVRELLEESQE